MAQPSIRSGFVGMRTRIYSVNDDASLDSTFSSSDLTLLQSLERGQSIRSDEESSTEIRSSSSVQKLHTARPVL